MKHAILVALLMMATGCVVVEDLRAEHQATILHDSIAVGMMLDRVLLASGATYGKNAWNVSARDCRQPEQVVQLTVRPDEHHYTFEVVQLREGQR
jgi:hypothetical protein